MRMALLTCAVFPSEAEARQKLWIFLKSTEKFGVPKEDLHLYGIGRGFPGYRAMKLDYQLEYLKAMSSEYTRICYTDSWDAFLVAPWTEVLRKYEAMGCPSFLASAYTGLGNVPDPDVEYAGCFNKSILYRYPNVGGYIAERDAVIDAFEQMMKQEEQTGDDCHNWYRFWKDGWRPILDSQCEIFQVTHERCHVEGNRLINEITGAHPCIWHLSGGYTSSDFGKDDRLIPWAKALGIIE